MSFLSANNLSKNSARSYPFAVSLLSHRHRHYEILINICNISSTTSYNLFNGNSSVITSYDTYFLF
ncbi:hypothetical protein T4D_12091 [Trichinella pseudospiralis]|uniref:Uncharacterized protein n=1 Tax=Trichinella pseudospiralis TaxID=6337 RepID=A0A0V1G6K3_TRIPS|nr:hypothetical protein T4D_12091 [Trichinella pseudospiralis]